MPAKHHLRDRLRNLVRQFGLTPAAQAALLRAVADEICGSPRLAAAPGPTVPAEKVGSDSYDAVRKRRSREAQALGLRALRCKFYISEETIAGLVSDGLIPDEEATSGDMALADALSKLLDQFYWDR